MSTIKSFNHIQPPGTIKLTASKKGYRVIDSASSKYNPNSLPPKYNKNMPPKQLA